MILLYTFGLLVLGFGAYLTRRRAGSLERKYMRAAEQAEQVAKEMTYKSGNSNQADLFTIARRQYELGRLVQIRDRLETKYDAWDAYAERFQRWRTGLLQWQGRVIPYALGALDLAVLFTGLLLGSDFRQLRETLETVRTVVRR